MGEPTQRRGGAAAARRDRSLARNRGGVGLRDPLDRLTGVGPARAADLAALGLHVAEDLLSLWPRRHLDRTALTPLAGLRPGLEATVAATVLRARLDPRPGRSGPILHVEVGEGAARLAVTFFHAAYLSRVFQPGRRVLLSGPVEWRGRQLAMTHPEWEALEEGEVAPTGLVPVYPLSGGLKQRWMREFMRRHVPALAAQAADPLPLPLRERLDLPPRAWAVTRMHFPADSRERERARRRLVFDEFFRIALAVQLLHGPGSQPGQAQQPDGP
ncbi:MAG: ATP-dependent DNA helicase RecG, partial [Firmicutes bacterium]|nr:ATP-dependent DNA helicase RecG [Bacillota bacterium]